MSSAGIQKLFCGIYSTFKCSFDEFVGEKVFSPSYSSTILAPPANLFLYDRQTLGPCVHRWNILKLGPGPAEMSGSIKALSFQLKFSNSSRSSAPIQVCHQTLVLLGIPKTPFPLWSYCTFLSSYLCVLCRQHRVKWQRQQVGWYGGWTWSLE